MPEQQDADLGALSDLCTPWCVHVVATLRIADHISAGRDQINDLAVAACCDSYALHRVLTHLVGKGVFEEPNPGRFALNLAAHAGSSTRRSGSGTWILRELAVSMALPRLGVHCLLNYVRTGAPAYHEIFSLPLFGRI